VTQPASESNTPPDLNPTAPGGAQGGPPGATPPGDAPSEGKPSRRDSGPWVLIGMLLLGALVVVLILYVLGVFSPSQTPGATATPASGGITSPYVTITSPTEGATLDLSQPVVVEGMGGNLFEGGLLVQVLDASGGVLAQQPTIVQSPEAGTGGEGPWQVTLDVSAPSGTAGEVLAYATSPKDGSRVAEAKVSVILGAPAQAEAFINIDTPQEGAVLDTSTVIRVVGTAGGLAEYQGNLTIEALDGQGAVIAMEQTQIQAPDAAQGGTGPWSVELSVPADTSGPGLIRVFSAPADAPVIAENSVNVSYNTSLTPPVEEAIKLEDHLWLLEDLNGKLVLDGTQIEAEFTEGRVLGQAGCNSYSASYERTADTLTVGEPSTTRRTCPDPQGVMDQETAYLQTLASAATFKIENQQLLVNDASDQTVLIYSAAVIGDIAGPPEPIDPQAVITVQLQDVSLADAAAPVLGEQQAPNPGTFPVPFAVTYNPETIQPNHTYAIRVRIEDAAGELLYTNMQSAPVITQGNPRNVEVVVGAVR
jgi:heat shock protein HslJ